jgi:hypothetical protein
MSDTTTTHVDDAQETVEESPHESSHTGDGQGPVDHEEVGSDGDDALLAAQSSFFMLVFTRTETCKDIFNALVIVPTPPTAPKAYSTEAGFVWVRPLHAQGRLIEHLESAKRHLSTLGRLQRPPVIYGEADYAELARMQWPNFLPWPASEWPMRQDQLIPVEDLGLILSDEPTFERIQAFLDELKRTIQTAEPNDSRSPDGMIADTSSLL